jgi:hypothetical protein
LLVEHFAFAQEPKLLDTVVTKDAQVPVALAPEVLASELVLAELLEAQQVEIAWDLSLEYLVATYLTVKDLTAKTFPNPTWQANLETHSDGLEKYY